MQVISNRLTFLFFSCSTCRCSVDQQQWNSESGFSAKSNEWQDRISASLPYTKFPITYDARDVKYWPGKAAWIHQATNKVERNPRYLIYQIHSHCKSQWTVPNSWPGTWLPPAAAACPAVRGTAGYSWMGCCCVADWRAALGSACRWGRVASPGAAGFQRSLHSAACGSRVNPAAAAPRDTARQCTHSYASCPAWARSSVSAARPMSDPARNRFQCKYCSSVRPTHPATMWDFSFSCLDTQPKSLKMHHAASAQDHAVPHGNGIARLNTKQYR